MYAIHERKELEKATLIYCFYRPRKYDHQEMKITPVSSRSKIFASVIMAEEPTPTAVDEVEPKKKLRLNDADVY